MAPRFELTTPPRVNKKGAPKGNQNAVGADHSRNVENRRNKRYMKSVLLDLLEQEVAAKINGKDVSVKRIVRLANAAIEAGEQGDIAAFNGIADRIDGKVPIPVDVKQTVNARTLALNAHVKLTPAEAAREYQQALNAPDDEATNGATE